MFFSVWNTKKLHVFEFFSAWIFKLHVSKVSAPLLMQIPDLK